LSGTDELVKENDGVDVNPEKPKPRSSGSFVVSNFAFWIGVGVGGGFDTKPPAGV
jgi:hypothetical protein